jgi:hypothetical protein
VALWLLHWIKPNFFSDPHKAAPAGAVFLAVFGLFGYLISAEREARRPFLDKQLTTCSDIAGISVTLATSYAGDEKSWRTADANFWEYYWGRLGMFEDNSLEGRMVQFGEMLRVVEGIFWKNGFANDQSNNARNNLRNVALCVAHTCRGLTQENWSVVPFLIRSPEAEYNDYCQAADLVYFCYCTKYIDKMSQQYCAEICWNHRTKQECDELLHTYNAVRKTAKAGLDEHLA